MWKRRGEEGVSDGSESALSDKLKLGALREAINQVNNWPLQIAHKNTGLLLSSSKCKTEGKCVILTALICLLM